jgi:CP family cyanate transporter-like MFS transporter
MSRYRFAIEALIFSVLISLGLSWMAVAPLFTNIMEEFGVSRAETSLLTSVVALMAAFFTLLGGIITAKIGLKKTFAIGAIAMAAGLLTPLSSNFAVLLATRVLFGLGAGIAFPPVSGLIMQWFHAREFPLMNALNGTGSSIGIVIGMFLTVPLADAFSWKMPLTLYGGITLGFALAWLVLGKERVTSSESELEGKSAVSAKTLITVIKQRITLKLALTGVGPIALWMGLSSWLPTYYHEVFGMPLAKSSFLVGLLNFVGIPACLLGGILPMKVGLRRPFLIIPGIILGLSTFGTFLVNDPLVIYGCVIIVGVCIWVYFPVLVTVPMEMPEMTPLLVPIVLATAVGICDLCGFIAPLVIGYLADATGSYLPGFIMWSVISWTLPLGGFLLPETGPRGRREGSTPT